MPKSEVAWLIARLDYAVDFGNGARLLQHIHGRIVKHISFAGKCQTDSWVRSVRNAFRNVFWTVVV
ncbi:MAG TPA: hypothetical protein VL334_23320 [Anaerolineae bacterium]|nr:hypothetical protein [Anaerolineae bacterium]